MDTDQALSCPITQDDLPGLWRMMDMDRPPAGGSSPQPYWVGLPGYWSSMPSGPRWHDGIQVGICPGRGIRYDRILRNPGPYRI